MSLEQVIADALADDEGYTREIHCDRDDVVSVLVPMIADAIRASDELVTRERLDHAVAWSVRLAQALDGMVEYGSMHERIDAERLLTEFHKTVERL